MTAKMTALPEGVTLTDCIINVLQSAYPEPMHYTEVTDVLVDDGIWEELPLTPAMTINNRITTNLKRRGSDFKRVGKKGDGLYTVANKYV